MQLPPDSTANPSPQDSHALNLSEFNAQYQLGVSFFEQKNWARAHGIFSRLVLEPHAHAYTWDALGMCFSKLGDSQRAIENFLAALRIDDTLGLIWLHLAVEYLNTGQHKLSQETYDKTFALDPSLKDASNLCNRGNMFLQQGLYEQGCEDLLESLRLDPQLAHSWCNLTNAYIGLMQWDKAIDAAQHAVALMPNFHTSHGVLALAQFESGLYDQALLSWERALCLNFSDMQIRWNRGQTLLALGRLVQGAAEFELARHHPLNAVYPVPTATRLVWRGEPVKNKKILLIFEQGLGDGVQFVRYAKLFKDSGAHTVGLFVPSTSGAILGSAPGIDQVFMNEILQEQAEEFDFEVGLMSCMHWCYTLAPQIPDTIPYLFPAPAKNSPILPTASASAKKIRIGIFWAGGLRADHKLLRVEKMRSIEFETLLPFLTHEGILNRVQWVILQAERRPDNLSQLCTQHDWLDPLADFAQEKQLPPLAYTAQIIQEVDLIIGVDSGLMHLSCALGKNSWMIDRRNSCWRWAAGLNQDTSHWYPKVLKIFRQKTHGDWQEVLERVKLELLN